MGKNHEFLVGEAVKGILKMSKNSETISKAIKHMSLPLVHDILKRALNITIYDWNVNGNPARFLFVKRLSLEFFARGGSTEGFLPKLNLAVNMHNRAPLRESQTGIHLFKELHDFIRVVAIRTKRKLNQDEYEALNYYAGRRDIANPKTLETFETHLKAGMDPNYTDYRVPLSMLGVAMVARDKDLVKVLLKYGAKPYVYVHAAPKPMLVPSLPTSENIRSLVTVQAQRRASKKDMYAAIRAIKGSDYKGIRKLRKKKDEYHHVIRNYITNSNMANYMRTKALRAPAMPPGIEQPKYLYRGMYGVYARWIKRNGYVDLKSYISFSRNYSIANRFTDSVEEYENYDGKDSILVSLDISTIPPGTPWVWYYPLEHRKNHKYRNTTLGGQHEDEVLLPPGRLTLLPGTDEVIYTPDAEAMSVLTKKKIIARLGSGKVDSSNAAVPMQPYQETWRLFSTDNRKRKRVFLNP